MATGVGTGFNAMLLASRGRLLPAVRCRIAGTQQGLSG